MKTIKKMTLLILAVITVQFANAQKGDWKEMHSFHSVMSKTFHPAEEGNIQPVKDNAKELVTKAKEWQASVVPAGYKKAETDETLKNLVAKCEEMLVAVNQKVDDAHLTKLIGEAHDVFHMIMEKCKKGDHGHDHKEGDGHKH